MYTLGFGESADHFFFPTATDGLNQLLVGDSVALSLAASSYKVHTLLVVDL